MFRQAHQPFLWHCLSKQKSGEGVPLPKSIRKNFTGFFTSFRMTICRKLTHYASFRMTFCRKLTHYASFRMTICRKLTHYASFRMTFCRKLTHYASFRMTICRKLTHYASFRMTFSAASSRLAPLVSRLNFYLYFGIL